MSKEMKKEPILKVEHLKMYFPLTKGFMKKTGGVVKAVDDISFSVEKGKTLGIVGESGCGKTTTGKCILQINKPTEGKILYEGQDLITMDRSHLKDCRRDIQMIFQDPFGSLDPRQKAFSIIREVLVEEGDEPVSALDVSIQAQIINLFKELQREMGLTYIFVAHDLAVVRHIADVIAVMYLGRIMEMMEAVELYKNPMHPYSQALLSAIPIVDYYEEQKRERILLKGEVPSPIHAPSGCPFHPRCPYASEKCRTAPPELKDVGNGHYVACYHVDKN